MESNIVQKNNNDSISEKTLNDMRSILTLKKTEARAASEEALLKTNGVSLLLSEGFSLQEVINLCLFYKGSTNTPKDVKDRIDHVFMKNDYTLLNIVKHTKNLSQDLLSFVKLAKKLENKNIVKYITKKDNNGHNILQTMFALNHDIAKFFSEIDALLIDPQHIQSIKELFKESYGQKGEMGGKTNILTECFTLKNFLSINSKNIGNMIDMMQQKLGFTEQELQHMLPESMSLSLTSKTISIEDGDNLYILNLDSQD